MYQFKVGDAGVTWCGQSYFVTDIDDEDSGSYVVHAKIGQEGNSYRDNFTIDGRKIDGKNSAWDLLPPVADTLSPSDPREDFKFKVGDRGVTRGGNAYIVKEVYSDGEYPVFASVGLGCDRFTHAGWQWATGPSDGDLLMPNDHLPPADPREYFKDRLFLAFEAKVNADQEWLDVSADVYSFLAGKSA